MKPRLEADQLQVQLVCTRFVKCFEELVPGNCFITLTLNTMCIIIASPALPGYLPAMFAAVRSNRLAPVSVQIQCTSIFFPTPRGPAISTDLISGAFSCTACEPVGGRRRKHTSENVARQLNFKENN